LLKEFGTVASDDARASDECRNGRIPHTPGVFVRAANKGIAGYGTWKSVRKMEAERQPQRLGAPRGVERAPGKRKRKVLA